MFIEIDKWLFSKLNGLHSEFLDGFMWFHTTTWIWCLFLISIIYVIIKSNTWKEAAIIFLIVAALIFVADSVSSSVIKPLFARLRPSHEPEFFNTIHTVNNYTGGRYGFISSHAANSFALVTFFCFLFRSKRFTRFAVIWAIIHSYSRVYLGVHYPGDILFGALFGFACGYIFYYFIYKNIHKYYYRYISYYSGNTMQLSLSVLFINYVCIVLFAIAAFR